MLAIIIGVALLIGFLTPMASILTGLGSIGSAFSWLPGPLPNSLDARLSIFYIAVTATAIVLLGPGAFSLDSYLFGRREIIIPPAPHPPES